MIQVRRGRTVADKGGNGKGRGGMEGQGQGS